MEELLFFVLGMIAEALGLKKKRGAAPPAPLATPSQRSPMPTSSSASRPASMSPPDRMTAQTMRPRRPDAGGPAVLRDATTAEFDAQEAELLASEPTSAVSPSFSMPSAPQDTPTLFSNTNDLIRAIILQEALGPPLCRRNSPGAG